MFQKSLSTGQCYTKPLTVTWHIFLLKKNPILFWDLEVLATSVCFSQYVPSPAHLCVLPVTKESKKLMFMSVQTPSFFPPSLSSVAQVFSLNNHPHVQCTLDQLDVCWNTFSHIGNIIVTVYVTCDSGLHSNLLLEFPAFKQRDYMHVARQLQIFFCFVICTHLINTIRVLLQVKAVC